MAFYNFRDLLRDFKRHKKNPEYAIDPVRSSALYHVKMLPKQATIRIVFQKTPGKVYEYWYNTHYHDVMKEFFDTAVKNRSRSWGKTFHMLLRLNWLFPKF